MSKAPTQPAKSSSVYGLPSSCAAASLTTSQKIRVLIIASAATACLYGSSVAARAAGPQSEPVHPANSAPHARSGPVTGRRCPSPEELDAALGKASSAMEHASYHEAIEALQSLSGQSCDPRVSLLLAAALEGSGDLNGAEQTLQKAHSVWPSNNSVAASLARDYYRNGQIDKAVAALEHFRPTATTPMQEIDLCVVVFVAGHQLVSAQSVAEAAYKIYPSVHSLLMLANALQLQGRFKEVIHLLNEKRNTYPDSPDFLITLAESEFDGILYDAARTDLEHAIALNQGSYQGHFLLGNVLVKLGEVDKAVAEYRTAIGLSPGQPRTYYQLALALQAKQDQEGAKQELQRAITADSHYAPARVEMGRLLLGENRFSECVDQLTLAVRDNPANEQAYFLLAKAYAGLGEKEKSDEMAKRLVAVRNANWQGTARKNAAGQDSKPATGP